jgi:Cu+-exporting ATPase
MSKVMEKKQLFPLWIRYHKAEEIIFDDKNFCCTGCKTVMKFLSKRFKSYYDFEKSPEQHRKIQMVNMIF